MADYRLGGNVDFSWLGNLPDAYREAKDRQTLKSTLADLTSTDPDSLEKKASQLIASGNLEAGLKLQQAALARRTLTQKGAADALQAEYLKNFVYPRAGGGQAAPADTGGPSISITQPPAQPGPDLFQGTPGAIPGTGPRSEAPAPPGPQQAAAPSPSDAIIAAAQGAQPGAPSGQQLAGPPPTPNTLPGQTPAMSAETLNAAAAPAVQATPAQGGPRPEPGLPTYQANAQAEADAVGAALARMPRQLAQSGPGRSLLERFRAAMGALKLDKDQQSWQEERISRARAGQPDISYGEYQTQLKVAPERIKEIGKLYVDQEKKSGQSGELISTLNRMEHLTKDPNFKSGVGANQYAAAISSLSFLARVAGVNPEELQGRLKDIVDPHLRSAAVIQEFNSLSNNALMAHVGSFSKSFSDADRKFVEAIFPQIIQTPGGIAKIIENLKEMANHAKGATKAARKYMADNDLRVTEHGYYQALEDYGDKNPLFFNPDGSLNDKGKALENAAKPQGAAPATGGGPARPMIQPGQTIYDKQGRPHTVNPDGSVSPLGGGST